MKEKSIFSRPICETGTSSGTTSSKRWKEPDLWIGKVGEEGRVFVGTDWDDALSAISEQYMPRF